MLPAPPRDGAPPPPLMLEPAAAGLSETQIWEAFAAAVRGEGPPAVDPDSVLPTMALLDAARESSASGAAVSVANRAEWVY
jgi:predicted dehydrogenase